MIIFITLNVTFFLINFFSATKQQQQQQQQQQQHQINSSYYTIQFLQIIFLAPTAIKRQKINIIVATSQYIAKLEHCT
jgi:hypothetical protein